MHESTQALRGKKLFLVGFTLFSMFFGAGNLIFPPFLGAQAGTALWLAFAGFFLNVSQFRRLTVVWFAGSLLKETGMVNPPVRRGNQRVGIWDNRGFRCWY